MEKSYKITLNEFKNVVKVLLKEEENFSLKGAINNILISFKKLEEEKNSYSLDQLKREYKLVSILEQAESSREQFYLLYKDFYKEDIPETFESEEIDSLLLQSEKRINGFIDDLEHMKKIFIEMGDLDKPSHYFSSF